VNSVTLPDPQPGSSRSAALGAQNQEHAAIYNRRHELEITRDNLVHMVVHDLRAPLTALISSLDFLRSGTHEKLNRTENACLANASDSAALLSEMIDTLLDISRLEAGKMPLSPAREDLEPLARSVATTLTPLLGHRRVTWETPRAPLHAVCDAPIVRRILTNLLDNAIRHTQPDGMLVLKIRRGADGAFLSVTDDGPGISPEFHTKIFEKFAQHGPRKKQTTGLGLTFCKLAVEAHGGRIGVTSEPNHGCTFWFTLPDAPLPEPGTPEARALQKK
jgi:signal transduction histidine kinase